MSEYLDLYEAIWEKAVDDDISKVVTELNIHGFNSAYETFTSKYLENKADIIVDFNDNETAKNCITIIKELQEINLVDVCNSVICYKTENDYHIINIEKMLYILKDKENYIHKDDKRFDKFKNELSDYCKIRTREIERRIRELVYKESQEWPHNKNYKIKDEEYNSKLAILKEEVADYAKEKMKKCWYKL